jgi:hypothetical protein
MSDEPQPTPAEAAPPSPQQLLDQAKRLKSQALYVGATRLIQESRHLREANERTREEAEKNRNTASEEETGSEK